MLMSFEDLHAKYNFQIDGILHVGAHLAEEAELYSAFNVPVWWVEANPAVFDKIKKHLRRFPNQEVIQALVYDYDGIELDFNVTNYDGMSSSILEFGTHTSFSPDTVFVDKIRLKTLTIDTIVNTVGVKANFLNMDLQGAELYALKGARRFLSSVDYVMTEVNKDQVYIGCAQIGELDAFLSEFKRVETHWVGNQGWGDALYIRR